MLKSALWYQEQGYSVIPVQQNKKPYIKWAEFQNKKATRQEIEQWWGEWPQANIGIVTGKISKINVVDVDTQAGLDLLNEYLPDTFLTPIARTPGGGWHYWFAYQPGLVNRARTIDGCDVRTDGGYITAPPSVNGTGRKYEWLEGHKISEVDFAAMPDSFFFDLSQDKSLKNIHSSTLVTTRGGVTNGLPSVTSSYVDLKKGGRDQSIFHIANCLVKGGMNHVDIEQVLRIIGKNCEPPFDENEISIKIKSATDRNDKKNRAWQQEVFELIELQRGYISVTKAYNELQVLRKQDKVSVRVAFKRLEELGMIEKSGRIAGEYKIIDRNTEKIDFLSADTTPYKIHLPFNLGRLVRIHPKNIIVIAGEQNSGKSALALNIARDNMYQPNVPIRYFSSEMGAVELRERLAGFDGISIEDWKKVDFRERSSNFEDVIDPDAINIIDFLEISDAFYKIAETMRLVYEKLRNGIAIIAIQKDSKAEYGRGSSFGLEKPRLYLTVSDNAPAGAILKIQKAKNWQDKTKNPNGLQIGFKIVNGCNLMCVGDWHRTGGKQDGND